MAHTANPALIEYSRLYNLYTLARDAGNGWEELEEPTLRAYETLCRESYSTALNECLVHCTLEVVDGASYIITPWGSKHLTTHDRMIDVAGQFWLATHE